MRHLQRPQFLDLLWDGEYFDDLAEFWLRLYERADDRNQFRACPYHALEIRLRGFARAQAAELEAELCRRLLTPVFPEPWVFRPDPDTLAFASGFAECGEEPARGLGLSLLDGPPFDGLLAEVRFTAAGFPGAARGKAKVAGTLVLVGELRGGRLLVKAVWRTGPVNWEDRHQWAAPWEDEQAWLGAFSKFRSTGEVPTDLAQKFFVTRGVDRMSRLAVRLIDVPLDRPRLGGLLLRLLFFAMVFALGGLIVLATVRWWWLWFAAVVPLIWIALLAWLFWAFVKNECVLFFAGRGPFYRGYARLCAEPLRLVPLAPEEGLPRLDNPWARKYTADLLALGCTHAGVFRLEPEVGGRGTFSVFLAPDGVTFLTLLLMESGPEQEPVVQQMWPAMVTLLAETWFPDGAHFASVNGHGNGYRRKRGGPALQARVFADVTDPAEFLHRHTEAMRRFATATQREPAPQDSFEGYLRRQGELNEEERRLYQDAPYTWSDHLCWYLQRLRRAYRD
jgi:hypothetical protein